MKRLLPILLTLALVFGLAVSAGAVTYTEGVDAPMFTFNDNLHYVLIQSSNVQYLVESNTHFVLGSSGESLMGRQSALLVGETVFYKIYQNDSGAWTQKYFSEGLTGEYIHFRTTGTNAFKFSSPGVVWSNLDFYDNQGNLVLAGSPVPTGFCDGSSCPATDLDHNNICDDCGNVLAFSLRSTLLEYVKSVAGDYSSGYPYYAVFENPLGGLNLYISKAPITIDGQDYFHVVGTSGQWTNATTDDTGVHSHDVFTAWTVPVGGTLVYANHEIENFQMPPLAVVIQGVTEGELMEVTLPNLAKMMKILVPCGVGCLALLIVLKLFGKRSLISRP